MLQKNKYDREEGNKTEYTLEHWVCSDTLASFVLPSISVGHRISKESLSVQEACLPYARRQFWPQYAHRNEAVQDTEHKPVPASCPLCLEPLHHGEQD